MAMLSGSPYFVDIYGHCGSSQIVEYCSNGNIHDIVNYARVTEEEKLAPIDKLRIAIQVTTAVSDLHEIDVVHQDICCHQFNFVDGVYKLSDFNIGALIFRDKQTKELCPAPRASMSDAVSQSWYHDDVAVSKSCLIHHVCTGVEAPSAGGASR